MTMAKYNHTKNIRRSLKLSVLALAAGSALLFSGCAKDPVSTERTDNAAITVDFLFEKDGVRVYRFYDGCRPIYYTDARGRTEWTDGGKHTTDNAVETVR
jgi:hypothetical protein